MSSFLNDEEQYPENRDCRGPVHHLLPRIPNYRLQESLNASSVLQMVKSLTIRKSLRSYSLNLRDEKQQKLVSFRSLKERREHPGITGIPGDSPRDII